MSQFRFSGRELPSNDPTVLAWAAAEGRVLVTHDVNTIPCYAYERGSRGERMPGVILVPQRSSIARCIEDLLLLAECSEDREWEGRVLFLPL
jgi:hypothetical protein